MSGSCSGCMIHCFLDGGDLWARVGGWTSGGALKLTGGESWGSPIYRSVSVPGCVAVLLEVAGCSYVKRTAA